MKDLHEPEYRYQEILSDIRIVYDVRGVVLFGNLKFPFHKLWIIVRNSSFRTRLFSQLAITRVVN